MDNPYFYPLNPFKNLTFSVCGQPPFLRWTSLWKKCGYVEKLEKRGRDFIYKYAKETNKNKNKKLSTKTIHKVDNLIHKEGRFVDGGV